MNRRILVGEGVCKTFSGIVALNGVDFEVLSGERLAVIGPNGSGKTTLMNCIAGRYVPDAGEIWFSERTITRASAHERAGLGIARTFQIPQPFRGLTVAENVMVPLEFLQPSAPMRMVREQAISALELFGLADKAKDYADALTQVDLRKLELARATAVEPKLLLADEPMAGLSDAEVDDILAILFALNARGMTIILIEHIMRAVRAFAQRIMCLDTGSKIADGSPTDVLRNARVEKAYLGE